MNNETEAFNAQESLRIIRQTIDVAKKNVQENGFYFLFWGVLTIGASLGDWYMQNILESENHGLPWLVMIVIGVPGSMLYGWLSRKQGTRPDNMLNNWYSLIWVGFGVSMIISLTEAGMNHASPVPLVLTLAAFATFMSGIILQFSPLRMGAIALWAGALTCFWVSPNHHSLVEAISIFLGYVVPGIMLNRQYRQYNGA